MNKHTLILTDLASERVLLTPSYSRLCAALAIPPDRCRPVFYMPESKMNATEEFIERTSDALVAVYRSINRVGIAPGDILVITTVRIRGVWILRGFEGREYTIRDLLSVN